MATTPSPSTDRLPPQDIVAEQSVLGSLLIDNNAFLKIADIVTGSDFYDNNHRIIFDNIQELVERERPVDIITISELLKSKKLLQKVGGNAYLTRLTNIIATAANVAYHAQIVYRKAVMRSLINASHHINELGYQEDKEIDDLIDQAEQHLFGISQRSPHAFQKIDKNFLEQAFERIEHLSKHTGEVRGVGTGFIELDQILSGFQKSDLIILAARPSVGKSAFALDIARNIARKNTPVGIFSLEMSVDQVVDRFLASTAHVDLWKIRTGKQLTDRDFTNIQSALETLSNAPVYIEDDLSSNILQMRTMARRLKAEHDLGLLIIDYLQLIQPSKRFSNSDNIVAQVSEISRSLKALARELSVPILALSQLSRDIEKRGGTPRLSDLRDSGAIEQDADVVMFLQREYMYDDDTEKQREAQINIAKHRNGPIGKVPLVFHREYASFKDQAMHTPEEPPPTYENPSDPDVNVDAVPI